MKRVFVCCLTLITIGCSKPQKAEPISSEERKASEEQATKQEAVVPAEEDRRKIDAPPPSEATPQASRSKSKEASIPEADKILPRLLVTEDEASGTIKFEGQMASRRQMERLIKSLAYELGERTYVDRIEYSDTVRLLAWASRVDVLWSQFFASVKDGVWEYENGVTRMSGRASKRVSDALQRATADIMEGPDAKAIDNQLDGL